MRRRALLRAGPAAVGLLAGTPATTSVRAHGNDDDTDEMGPTADDDFFREESSGSLEPLGRVDVEGAAEAVVGDDGETAYLATYDGIAAVDVSDPAEPTVLADRREPLEEDEYGRFADVLDVDVDGDRLAAVGPANPAPSSVFHGLVVYDVSDPADPVLAREPFETNVHLHNCYLQDDLCFLVANDGDAETNGDAENALVICDVGGDQIEEVGRWSLLEVDERWADVYWLLWYLHDVTVRDDLAVLAYWNAGTVLLDVSDPSAPELVSRIPGPDVEDQLAVDPDDTTEVQRTLPGNDHYSVLDDRGAVLGIGKESWAEAEGATDGAGGIELYDVSDPAEPAHLSTIDAPATPDASYHGGTWTTAHNFELHDGILYSSWYLGGIAVHDVTEPARPTERGRWRDPETAAFWTARVADGSFVASSTEIVPNADTEGALYTFPLEEPRDDRGTTGGEGNDEFEFDPLSGFSAIGGLGGLAGGALALEWHRRRTRGESK